MYVCICNGVTERQIIKQVEAGATTLSEIQFELGVGTCCGQCTDCARQVIDSARATQAHGAGATLAMA